MERTNIDWDFIRQKLPYERTPEQTKQRTELWKFVDINGNGIASLAEVDKAMRDVFVLFDIFESKPVMIRAFNAAKAKCPPKTALSDDYIERREFRLLLLYLRQYFEYYQAFCRIDLDDDRRIDFTEFKKGIPSLERWTKIDISNPQAIFNEIDTNGGGIILFDEFARWAIKKSLDLEDDDD
jgi:Ca2+-binding EF-hand superfamily protein